MTRECEGRPAKFVNRTAETGLRNSIARLYTRHPHDPLQCVPHNTRRCFCTVVARVLCNVMMCYTRRARRHSTHCLLQRGRRIPIPKEKRRHTENAPSLLLNDVDRNRLVYGFLRVARASPHPHTNPK